MSSKLENKKRNILVVDDDPASRRIIKKALEYEGYQVDDAESGVVALEKINQKTPSLILLDVSMPDLNGLDTLKMVRQKPEYVSTIFISGKNNTEDVIRGLDAGADDYIGKPFDSLELLSRVRSQLRNKDIRDELARANERLQELVDIDDLTGLFNMRSLFKKLDHELDRAHRYHRSVCVVMMDMDHFKQVNDNNDHLFGSYVLAETGKIIKNNMRTVDFAARYGGDEFLICLTEVDKEGAEAFTERLRKVIEERVFDNGHFNIQLTSSIGYSLSSPGSHINGQTLVRYADRALYKAKEAGRNRVEYVAVESAEEAVQLSRPELLRKA